MTDVFPTPARRAAAAGLCGVGVDDGFTRAVAVGVRMVVLSRVRVRAGGVGVVALLGGWL